MGKSSPEKSLWVSAAAGVALSALLAALYRRRREQKYAIPPGLRSSPCAKELRVAIALARQAGANMHGYCDAKGTAKEEEYDLGIATKGQAEDFCTRIDVENEDLVTKGILKHFPEHKIIGEETVGQGEIPPLTADPTWIIDPIDGTTNFASGIPLTCVSIGFCIDSVPSMGVVYAPMTDELYLAVKGYGSYRNGIRISKRSDKTLLESVVCFEFGYAREPSEISQMVKAVERILQHGCRTTRSLGSGVLDLLYVATGRIDVVYAGVASEGFKPWDYCAGCVIAEEAGCVMETIGGNTVFDIYSKSMICAVGKRLATELRQRINSS